MRALTPTIALLVGILAGCAGAPSPTVTSTPTPGSTVAATSSATAVVPTATAAAATPRPTLVATTTEASEAPPDAVIVEMKVISGNPLFEPTEITVKAGSVSFFLQDVPTPSLLSGTRHNFVIGPALLDPIAQSADVPPLGAAVFTVESLPAGTYTFWCSINEGGGPHYAFGMVGTLSVSP